MRDDVEAIVGLLRNDPLGQGREGDNLGPYAEAFDAIDVDPRNALIVICPGAESADAPAGSIAGTMQLTLIPGLSRGAMTRLQIEAVRVADEHRGAGLGGAMFAWAHDLGARAGAGMAQLTSDVARPDAIRFYERLGYVASHQGLKLDLRVPETGGRGRED